MQITGTHIAYYFVCHRKLWLFANGIQMEHTSDKVLEGKLVHESSYASRSEQYSEIEMEGIKIDFYDARTKTIHETKLSSSLEQTHAWQLKYYIWVLKKNGIEGVKGLLEYPKLRETKAVYLSEEDEEVLEDAMNDIALICAKDVCPQRLKLNICKKCSYYDFCWSGEINE